MATTTTKATMSTTLVGEKLTEVGGVAVAAEDQLVITAVKDYTDIGRYPKDKLCIELFSGKEYGITLSEGITTVAVAAPTASTLLPADDATGVAIDADLVITFSETILAGSGDVVLYNAADAVIETFNVKTSGLITIVDDEVTIAPTADLANSTGYYVQIDATAFTGTVGNAYAGIADKTTWSFTTVA